MAPASLRRNVKNGTKGRSRGDLSVASGVTDVSLSLDDDDDDERRQRRRNDDEDEYDDDDVVDDTLYARRTESLDAPHVTALAAAAAENALAQFGRVDVARVWEKRLEFGLRRTVIVWQVFFHFFKLFYFL